MPQREAAWGIRLFFFFSDARTVAPFSHRGPQPDSCCHIPISCSLNAFIRVRDFITTDKYAVGPTAAPETAFALCQLILLALRHRYEAYDQPCPNRSDHVRRLRHHFGPLLAHFLAPHHPPHTEDHVLLSAHADRCLLLHHTCNPMLWPNLGR